MTTSTIPNPDKFLRLIYWNGALWPILEFDNQTNLQQTLNHYNVDGFSKLPKRIFHESVKRFRDPCVNLNNESVAILLGPKKDIIWGDDIPTSKSLYVYGASAMKSCPQHLRDALGDALEEATKFTLEADTEGREEGETSVDSSMTISQSQQPPAAKAGSSKVSEHITTGKKKSGRGGSNLKRKISKKSTGSVSIHVNNETGQTGTDSASGDALGDALEEATKFPEADTEGEKEGETSVDASLIISQPQQPPAAKAGSSKVSEHTTAGKKRSGRGGSNSKRKKSKKNASSVSFHANNETGHKGTESASAIHSQNQTKESTPGEDDTVVSNVTNAVTVEDEEISSTRNSSTRKQTKSKKKERRNSKRVKFAEDEYSIPTGKQVMKILKKLGYSNSGINWFRPDVQSKSKDKNQCGTHWFEGLPQLRRFLCLYGVECPGYTEVDDESKTLLEKWIRYSICPSLNERDCKEIPSEARDPIGSPHNLLVELGFKYTSGEYFEPGVKPKNVCGISINGFSLDGADGLIAKLCRTGLPENCNKIDETDRLRLELYISCCQDVDTFKFDKAPPNVLPLDEIGKPKELESMGSGEDKPPPDSEEESELGSKVLHQEDVTFLSPVMEKKNLVVTADYTSVTGESVSATVVSNASDGDEILCCDQNVSIGTSVPYRNVQNQDTESNKERDSDANEVSNHKISINASVSEYKTMNVANPYSHEHSTVRDGNEGQLNRRGDSFHTPVLERKVSGAVEYLEENLHDVVEEQPCISNEGTEQICGGTSGLKNQDGLSFNIQERLPKSGEKGENDSSMEDTLPCEDVVDCTQSEEYKMIFTQENDQSFGSETPSFNVSPSAFSASSCASSSETSQQKVRKLVKEFDNAVVEHQTRSSDSLSRIDAESGENNVVLPKSPAITEKQDYDEWYQSLVNWVKPKHKWVEVRSKMLDLGLKYVTGQGLHAFEYVFPGKRPSRENGKINVDFLVEDDDMKMFAVQNFGWKADDSFNEKTVGRRRANSNERIQSRQRTSTGITTEKENAESHSSGTDDDCYKKWHETLVKWIEPDEIYVEVRNKMLAENKSDPEFGMRHVKGGQLDGWEYVFPGRKSSRENGKRHVDYLLDDFDFRLFAVNNFGWKGDDKFKKEQEFRQIVDTSPSRRATRMSQSPDSFSGSSPPKKKQRN
eukprot:CAMPEP_0178905452 /NCGR_PEP_ID=MMETSP0786-20121207/6283_1 /TAXON_ID=186022 /ORGANISM="Thalassionema frauenfeldii, Strain CCMP 1798" /LENGTH=1168 /DNA_ID=CAMNT_0020577061 /DNA_START=35 /DNA_END=3538 /DNA_ORIENTATION=+